MLSTYPGLDVGKITQRKYSSLLSQAINISVWKAGGKLESETMEDQMQRAYDELNELKAKGRWQT